MYNACIVRAQETLFLETEDSAFNQAWSLKTKRDLQERNTVLDFFFLKKILFLPKSIFQLSAIDIGRWGWMDSLGQDGRWMTPRDDVLCSVEH